jgi:RNA polymerase sigma-70 factor (ECF subfamily)
MNRNLEEAFLAAVELNQHKLLRICSVYAKDTEESKDLFQEVLIQVWKSMPSFKAQSTLETWMFRIALNVCLRFRSNHVKKKNRFISIDHQFMADTEHDPAVDERREQLRVLKGCIKQLNEADKAVITLYLEELPYKEISNVTGLTENTVAVKIKRIKMKLLNCLKKVP